jgi:hypothetical protein
VLLIETREPLRPAPEPRPPRTWPLSLVRLLWRFLAGVGLLLLSGAFPPVEAYALILAACVLIGRGLGTLAQSTTGLKDYRQ